VSCKRGTAGGEEFCLGEFATYSGGGYLLYLGRTLYNTLLNFQNMMTKVWIDVDTRVIFVEFLTYNANYNYFSSVRLTVEQSATGYTHKLIRVGVLYSSSSSA
jgi:hypothetical protein